MAVNQEERFLTGIKFDNSRPVEECHNNKLDDLGDFWGLNWGIWNFHNHNAEKTIVFDDVADLLPQDPFGMDVDTQVTAITGWLDDLDKDFGLRALGLCTNEFEVDDHLFAEVNFVWDGALRIHQEAGVQKVVENSNASDIDLGERSHDAGGPADTKMEDIMGFNCKKHWVFSDATHNDQGSMNNHCDGDGGDPSDALNLALGFLGLSDLLSVERVCKTLRDVVRGDPLLWRNIHIDHPLSGKVTDDILIKLTDRAQGHLHVLSLVQCSKITDSGLYRVLERNPSLKKLNVPGCGRLTVDGILFNLKVFKSAGKPRLKYLGIDGLSGVTNQHFEEFKVLLGVDVSKLATTRKPRFFQDGQLSMSSDDDDHAIDIEICPKCQQFRRVYDCPSESCQKKQSATQLCRACTICVKRCINCGRCLNNCEYEELFTFDLLCLDCFREVLIIQRRRK